MRNLLTRHLADRGEEVHALAAVQRAKSGASDAVSGLPHRGRVRLGELEQRRAMLARHDDRMPLRHRRDIHEREDALVLHDATRLERAGDDPAEGAVDHLRP